MQCNCLSRTQYLREGVTTTHPAFSFSFSTISSFRHNISHLRVHVEHGGIVDSWRAMGAGLADYIPDGRIGDEVGSDS